MAQGKCSLLKPVDSLTGTFFMFSQYTQDLTKQYSNPDSYRCVPSKYVAMNLDYSSVYGNNTEDLSKTLGEIFQNYFENACTFLRGVYGVDWNPEYARTLIFQALEKYQMITISEGIQDTSSVQDSSESTVYGLNSGISENIQYIGDINIYSYDDNAGGVGYNEIYCYIPNEAKCTNYQLGAVPHQNAHEYTYTNICGYEDQTSYSGLTWAVENFPKPAYIDKDLTENCYAIGYYGTPESYSNALVPQCLNDITSDDKPRKINIGTEEDEEYVDIDKFDVNAILVLYDIVSKNEEGGQYIIYKNVPLGIYFTGCLDENKIMSNTITKYVDSGQVYNQGTSYGLRICTRFLSNPYSTEIIESTTQASSNISEMAPVLEKMGEVLMSVQDILDDKDQMYQLVKDHLAQFKNNKVNVPYVRQLGTKKYWFVNGKNTGAIAQYEYAEPQDIVNRAVELVMQNVWTRQEIGDLLTQYINRNEFIGTLENYYTKEQVDEKLAELEKKLLVYLQGVDETETVE